VEQENIIEKGKEKEKEKEREREKQFFKQYTINSRRQG